MKKQQLVELKNLKTEELEKKVQKLKDELSEAEVKISAGEEKNVKIKKEKRRDIAQILSIIYSQNKQK